MLKTQKNKQMSETYLLGGLLAIVGGFLDAYTYISRGHVFANAQTGNIVLLGLNIAEKSYKQAFYYVIPIIAFVMGVFVAEIIKSRFKQYSKIHWRQIVVLIEALVLGVIALIPQGNKDVIANVAISFVCSLQVQSFRKVNGNAFATTMCTGNLRSATELLVKYNHTKKTSERNKSFQYYGIILLFMIGVILGTILTNRYIEKSVLFCCIILLVVFGIMFIKEDIEKEPIGN